MSAWLTSFGLLLPVLVATAGGLLSRRRRHRDSGSGVLIGAVAMAALMPLLAVAATTSGVVP
jgi:uncharacterized membrane protein